MLRTATSIAIAALTILTACTKKPPPPEQIAKLRGGTTTVIAYGFCIPIQRLLRLSITSNTMTYVVNGKPVGTMRTCSYAKFKVPSGYWESHFNPPPFLGMQIPHRVPASAFKPGATQYLHMYPNGNSGFYAAWVPKSVAEKGIAELKQIH